MRLAAFIAALFVATGASAMTYFLTAQWVERGDRFCKYSDGTVLNVGTKLCPLQIKG